MLWFRLRVITRFCSQLKWPFLSLAARFRLLPELTGDLQPDVRSCLIPGFSGAVSPSFGRPRGGSSPHLL